MMEQWLQHNLWLLVLLGVWIAPWKGWALWKAARRGDTGWFIALLFIQTLAVLDILYIYVFSSRKTVTSPAKKI